MSAARQPALGIAAIALAILFNLPYAILAASFDYPAILRRPPAEVLTRFAEGGAGLVLTWYAFALAALALTPLAIGLSLTPRRLVIHPALAASAAARLSRSDSTAVTVPCSAASSNSAEA